MAKPISMIRKLLFFFILSAASQAQNTQGLRNATFYNWENESWKNWLYQEWEYTDGLAEHLLYKVWDVPTQTWKNSSQTFITNVNGFAVDYVSQSWIDASNSWLNASHSIYTYTDFNKMDYQILQLWADGNWANQSKDTNVYDASNFVTGQSHQGWSGSMWEDQYRTVYTNDANGNMLEYTLQLWTGSSWRNTQKLIQTFSNTNKILTAITQSWTAENWVNATKNIYSYDGSDYMVYALFQNWQTDNTWKDSYQYFYTNNPDGRIAIYISQDWIESGAYWKNYQKAVYNYSTLGLPEAEAAVIGIYPNPSQDFLQIVTNDQTAMSVKLVDTQGRTVQPESIFTNATTVDIRNLPTGNYIVILEKKGKETFSRKFIKK